MATSLPVWLPAWPMLTLPEHSTRRNWRQSSPTWQYVEKNSYATIKLLRAIYLWFHLHPIHRLWYIVHNLCIHTYTIGPEFRFFYHQESYQVSLWHTWLCTYIIMCILHVYSIMKQTHQWCILYTTLWNNLIRDMKCSYVGTELSLGATTCRELCQKYLFTVIHSKVWFIMAASISATTSTSGKGTKGSVLALCSRGCPSHCRQTSHSACTRRSLTR